MTSLADLYREAYVLRLHDKGVTPPVIASLLRGIATLRQIREILDLWRPLPAVARGER